MNHQEPKLNKSRRRLPHWERNGATYFVTFRLLKGVLTDAECQHVLDHLIAGDGVFYRLLAGVVMPDHVHLLIRPKTGYELSRVMKGIKGVSARLVSQSRGATGSLWQDESHDRIMRDEDEAIEKARYILDNPRRAGLVDNPLDYPFQHAAVF